MKSRELILLGILMAQSLHGYQIHEFIERNLSHLTDMKKATAYGVLEKLNKAGYIDIRVEQEGNRPPRKTYTMNEKGIAYFMELLRENLSADGHLHDPADIGLMFMDYLPVEERMACMNVRREKLEQRIRILEEMPGHGTACGVSWMTERNLVMLRAELDWLDHVLDQMRGGEG